MYTFQVGIEKIIYTVNIIIRVIQNCSDNDVNCIDDFLNAVKYPTYQCIKVSMYQRINVCEDWK